MLKRNRFPHLKPKMLQVDNHMKGETSATSRDLDDNLKSIFICGTRSRSKRRTHKLGGTLQSYRNDPAWECAVRGVCELVASRPRTWTSDDLRAFGSGPK